VTPAGKARPSLLVRALGAQTSFQASRALWGYIFATPWILGLVFFVAGPILASLVLSLTEYDILAPPRFSGLANYRTAFLQDDLFWSSLRRTFYYAMVYVPIAVLGSLFLAIMVNQGLGGSNIFRILFFLPHLTPGVALAVLWLWLLQPQVGPVNYALGKLGLPQPGWFTDPSWALPSIILISLWSGMGGNRMLIFLAGLQGVPQELYEAAEIDGAGAWSRFRHVCLPMISPTVFFNLVLGVIGALQVFTVAFVATEGGPARATWFYALHIFRQAFRYYRLGYGSALAWILAVILLVFTYIQIVYSERWVYYAGE